MGCKAPDTSPHPKAPAPGKITRITVPRHRLYSQTPHAHSGPTAVRKTISRPTGPDDELEHHPQADTCCSLGHQQRDIIVLGSRCPREAGRRGTCLPPAQRPDTLLLSRAAVYKRQKPLLVWGSFFFTIT